MNYPYANGQIKALESIIFDKTKFSKLIKTPKADFLKTLIDLGYGVNADNLEDIINGELSDVKKLLDEISPQKKYTDLFFLANDALNIKAAYKKKIFGIDHLDIFVDTGTISKADLEKAVIDMEYQDLPKEYQELFSSLDERLKNEINPRLVSAKVDNSIYQFIFDRIKFPPIPALKAYFQASIDFSNVLTLIRSKKLNWPIEEFKEMFLKNGQVDINVFLNIYNVANDLVLKSFRDFYNEKITKGLKEYFESNDIDLLEHYFDSLIIQIMKEYQYESFGIGPIINYYLKKLAEAKNIRLIYANNEIDLIDLLEY